MSEAKSASFQATVILTFRDGRVEEAVLPVESVGGGMVYLEGGERFGPNYGPFCLGPDEPGHQAGAFQCQPPPSGERLSPDSIAQCLAWQAEGKTP